MSETEFVLNLGGSRYLTPGATVVGRVPDGATAYPLPAGLVLDPGLVVASLGDLTDPAVAPDELVERWVSAGQEDQTAHAFLSAVEVAAEIGAIFLESSAPGLTHGLEAAAKLLGAFGKGDGYDARTGAALVRLRQEVRGEAEIDRADKLLDWQAAVRGQFEPLRAAYGDLLTHRPVGAARLAAFEQMRGFLDAASGPVARIRDEDWTVTNLPDDHKARVGVSAVLVRDRPGGSTERVPAQAPGLTRFDPRLGVPTLLWLALAYPSMIRLAVPWFRSDGTYREQLRQLAGKLDEFVLDMQAECWSRTEHTAQTMFAHDVFPAGLLFGAPLGLGGPNRYPVGAFDLARYSDAYLHARYSAALGSGGDPGAVGTFDYTWTPPGALLDPVGRLIDRQQGAAAANEQARADHARLVVVSGAVPLMLASALLRHLSAPPTASETVAGAASGGRRLVDEEPVTATSATMFPNVTVTAPATLRRYEARARVGFNTQLPGHAPALRYRVLLRTIDSRTTGGGWRSDGYLGHVWWAELEPLPGDPANKRLRTDLTEQRVLGEVKLYEGVSPAEPQTRRGEGVRLPAHTFDWYVPAAAPSWSLEIDDLQRVLGDPAGPAPGSRSLHLTDRLLPSLAGAESMPVRDHTYEARTRGALTNVADTLEELPAGLGALADLDLAAAERRHARPEDVTVDWELRWADGRLEVRLTGRPQERSVQVWVVVEEAVQSGEDGGEVRWLHTPVAAEVVNQATLVPRSFFDEEAEALARGGRLWDELIRRFSELAEVGPDDPVVAAVFRARETLTESASTVALVEALQLRLEAMQQHQPELWQRVVG